MTTKPRNYFLYAITLGLLLAMSLIASSLMYQEASSYPGVCRPIVPNGEIICFCDSSGYQQDNACIPI